MSGKSFIKFIGSGCWQGTPAPFCDDKISPTVLLNKKDFRFRTSLALYSKTGKMVIFEITPDIRLQSWKYKLPKPESFFVTHWHFDHLFGLFELDWYAEKYGLNIYVNKDTKKFIDKSINHVNASIKLFKNFKEIVFEEYIITPFEVNHVHSTHGFLIFDGNKKIAYIPDWNGLPEESFRLIEGADIIICDATYLQSSLTDDKTHFSHSELLSYVKKFNKSKIVFTNIGSFSNVTHEELVKKYPKYAISFDGMIINFKS